MKNLLSALFVGISFLAYAQPKGAVAAYTIQVGAFQSEAAQVDFELIRSYAYLYLKDGFVNMGMFYTQEAADSMLVKVKSRGYNDAIIKTLPLASSAKTKIIQVITQTAGEPIEWAKLDAALKEGESLYVYPNENQVRIVVGTFEDMGLARARAAEIQEAGFAGAYARDAYQVLLSPASDFDRIVRKQSRKGLVSKGKGVKGNPSTGNEVPSSYSQIKRIAAVELQKTLKNMGNYAGNIDGKFGTASETAYKEALEQNRRLKKYNEASATLTGFEGWEDGRLLVTISRDLNAKNEVVEPTADLFKNLPTTPLSNDDEKAMQTWQTATWNRLDAYAKQSKLNAQTITALKLAYFHTQMHLEKELMKGGMNEADANGVAIWILKNLVGDDLENM